MRKESGVQTDVSLGVDSNLVLNEEKPKKERFLKQQWAIKSVAHKSKFFLGRHVF